MSEIIKAIWELPWYQVIIIAIIDDLIVFVKIWPLYVFIVVAFITFATIKYFKENPHE